MTSQQQKGVPLPKFGEWDVNNPASAEGFTVIFSKAGDEKKSKSGPGNLNAASSTSQQTNHASAKPGDNYDYPSVNKWFCCI